MQLTHIDALSCALMVPGAHSVGSALPTGQKVPTGQMAQSLALVITSSKMFMCVPPGHGSGAAEPAGQYDPASHALHAVWPDRSWYVPPAHDAQLSLTGIDAFVYEPLAHAVCCVLPVTAKEPASAGVQSL